MPVFECTKCHAVENTALSNFACRVYLDKKEPLCSECDPDIGKWHGQFEKKTAQEAGLVPDTWGSLGPEYLSPPGGWK